MNRQISVNLSDQKRPVRTFGRMMKRGLLAHAYLLLGVPGTGKEELAFFFAKLILCENPYLEEDLPRPCGVCRGCIKFDHKVHPDLEILRPQGAMIKLDQIRDLQKTLSFAPLDSQRRVCLILEAQKINLPAANALLKTLEEPPGGNYFILSSTSDRSLLPTIISRCQAIHCEGLSIRSVLEHIKKERLYSSDLGHFIAFSSEGSLSRARDLIEHDILQMRENLLEFLRSERERALKRLFILSDQISNKRESVLIAIQVIRTFLRDIMILKGVWIRKGKKQIKPEAQMLYNPDYQSQLQTISDQFDFQDLALYGQWLDKVEWLLDRNISREFIAESILIFWIRKRK